MPGYAWGALAWAHEQCGSKSPTEVNDKDMSRAITRFFLKKSNFKVSKSQLLLYAVKHLRDDGLAVPDDDGTGGDFPTDEDIAKTRKGPC
jgi:hypothetical protein